MPKKKILDFTAAKDFLLGVGGDYAAGLVKICERKKESVTDEEISKALGLKVTEVRTILNRLHYRGIASYQKAKNKKTGWCNFTWEINQRRIAELLLEIQEEQLEKLEKKHSIEGTYMFFGCKKNCTNVPFEIAAEYQFKCPECNSSLEEIDNKRKNAELWEKLATIKDEVIELKKYLK